MMSAWDVPTTFGHQINGDSGEAEYTRSLRDVRDDPNVVDLTLNRLSLDDETATTMCQLLKSRHWKSVTISHCSAENIESVVSAVLGYTRRLEIRGNELCRGTARVIQKGLKSDKCYVRKLCLSNVLLSKDCADLIGQGVSTGRIIEEFAYSEIQPEQGILSTLLGVPSRLQSLYLCGCHLDDKHMKEVADSLIQHPLLKQLWINGKQSYGEPGVRLILDALIGHVELIHIQLPCNFECSKQIQSYTELNRGGRKLLVSPNASLSLWPYVLERVKFVNGLNDVSRANILYFFVQQLHGRERIDR